MQALPRLARGRAWALGLLIAGLSACQVLPPEHGAATGSGSVRASTPERANAVAALFERLEPEVLALLPEARERALDVWVQDRPALYRFAQGAYQDADGFFSESQDRIHLRAGADDLERTLAHELVHAHLRGAWRALPGTLEEGLCDHVSGELCPAGRSALRAGRLSCAAFALGGLALDLAVQVPLGPGNPKPRLAFQARLRVEGDPPMEVEPLGVFQRQAGLSSSRLTATEKKAYYGLAFFVADRLVRRVGIEGLHRLCAEALAQEESRVPAGWLLAAAGLDANPATWRAALEEEFEEDDLRALVEGHAEFLTHTLIEVLGAAVVEGEDGTGLAGVRAELSVAGTARRIDLLSIPEVRASLVQASRARRAVALARR